MYLRYQRFLSQLRSDELRDVQASMINPRLTHDILGSLPLELVVQVVRFLDTSNVLRLQRVRVHIVTVHKYIGGTGELT